MAEPHEDIYVIPDATGGITFGPRPKGAETGLLSNPERRDYAIELWRQGLSDERIAVACTRAFNIFVSKNVVVGCRHRDGWQRSASL